MPFPLAPCGTLGAYKRHRRRHEPVDDACEQAHRDDLLRLTTRTPDSGRALTRRLDRQAEAEQDARASRLLAGIRDEHWGSPWWLTRPPEATTR